MRLFITPILVPKKRKIVETTPKYSGGELKKKAKKRTPPSSYVTMPYYFSKNK
jgi:hypothetical protein